MLVDPHRLGALVVVAVAVISVPGPSVLFVVSRAVSLGRAAALATVLGNELGLLVQVGGVAFGFGAIIERSIVVYTIIKLIGAGYLVYLGVQAIRHRKDVGRSIDGTTSAGPVRLRRIFGDGVLVGVSNPKGFLLFAAILPQFTDLSSGRVPVQLLLLGGVCVVIAFVSDTAWAFLAGSARTWLSRSTRRIEAMGGAAGVIMVGLGLQVAVTGRRD